MTQTLLQAFLFFLPAGIANMVPVFANKIPLLNKWNTPIDFGYSYKNVRLLGDNKRWRGLVWGALIASATAVLLELALPNLLPFTSLLHAWSGGLLLGTGALVGDAVESFFKRRRGVAPGKSWFPFDQIDFIIGGLLFVSPLLRPTLEIMVTILVIYFALHLASSYLGYIFKLKELPV